MRRIAPKGVALPLGALFEGALTPDIKRGLALADLTLKWNDVVGPLASRSRPLRIDDERLVVVADSPALAQRLKIQAGGVIRKIREGWGLPLSGLQVVVGPVRMRRRQAPSPPPPVAAPTEEELTWAKGLIAAHIEDEKTTSALARLMAVYRRRFGGTFSPEGAPHPKKE